MPIFEYRCKKCGHQFDALVRHSDEKVSCKFCDSKDLERLFSAFAVQVSGGNGGVSSCPTGTCPLP